MGAPCLIVIAGILYFFNGKVAPDLPVTLNFIMSLLGNVALRAPSSAFTALSLSLSGSASLSGRGPFRSSMSSDVAGEALLARDASY